MRKTFRWIFLTMLMISIILSIVEAATPGGLLVFMSTADENWYMDTARFLVSPVMRTILLTIGMLGLMIEALTLWTVSGGIGMFALTLFFLSHMAMGIGSWRIILVFIFGMFLLFVEIFVTPGFGLLGITGIICTYVSLFLMMMNDPAGASISLVTSTGISIGAFIMALKYLPKSKVWKNITLQSTQSSSDGYVSSKQRVDLEGAMGVTASDLRPAGVAIINGERVDVVTEGGFIKKDTPVMVVKTEGVKIIVKPVEGTW